MSPARVEALDHAEPLEDDERVVVDGEIAAEAAPKVDDVAVPEAFVRDAELGRIRVALALVDGVAIVDVGEANDATGDGLDDGNGAFG